LLPFWGVVVCCLFFPHVSILSFVHELLII
jgi:hypothetical protein